MIAFIVCTLVAWGCIGFAIACKTDETTAVHQKDPPMDKMILVILALGPFMWIIGGLGLGYVAWEKYTKEFAKDIAKFLDEPEKKKK